MGTPLPPIPIEPGDLCSVCWGSGRAFDEPTPLKVFLALHDWSEGQFFNEAFRTQLETPQELSQIPGFPCEWNVSTANFGWFVQFAPSGSFYLVDPIGAPGVRAFNALVPLLCQEILTNEIIVPNNNIIFGGTASVYFGSAP